MVNECISVCVCAQAVCVDWVAYDGSGGCMVEYVYVLWGVFYKPIDSRQRSDE